MARWEPDARGRLQYAAMVLFSQRGYAGVTVADIADRAGVTKRTFFNHFPDKREVLFGGAGEFEASVLAHLAAAPLDESPVDAVASALTLGGLELARYSEFAKLRRDVIVSAPELQERDLTKMSALASSLAAVLGRRGTSGRTAKLAAQVGLTIFRLAYDEWVDDTTTDLAVLMQDSLAELRQTLGPL